MSQQQNFGSGGSAPGTPNIEFLSGNDGLKVGPNPATFTINLIGDTTKGVHVTNTASFTEQITIDNATTTQRGVALLSTNPQALAGTDTTTSMTPQDVQVKVGAQTLHGLAYGAGNAAAIQWLGEASNGQIPIGSTGNAPQLGFITSSDGSVAITNGPGSINLSITDSGTVTSVSVVSSNGFAGTVATATTTPAITLTTTQTGILSGNGTAISGNAVNQFDVLVGGASNSISSIGTGTSGQLFQSGGNLANPAYTTSTYPATTTINQILYSSSANVVGGLTTANDGVLTTGTSGIPVITPLALNGQLIIGSSSGAPAAALLTAGPGISIIDAANSITISSSQTVLAYTAITHNGTNASPYTVLTTDNYISVDTTATTPGTVTILMPNAPTTNKTWIIKDRTGAASTNNISVTTVGGSVTIDGQTTYKITSNYGAIQLLFNGNSYEVF